MDNKKPKCVENKIKDMLGKQNYKQTIMNYSKEIALELKNNPDKLNFLLNDLELDQQTLFDANITFYEYILDLLKDNKYSVDDNGYAITLDINNSK